MDFNTLMGVLGPEAQAAVSSFYFGDDGVPTFGAQQSSAQQSSAAPRGPGGRGRDFGTDPSFDSINPSSYLSDDKEGASRLFADIIRAQTQDYLTRFAPIEDFLAGSITEKGTTFLEGDMARTREAIAGGAQSARDQYTRRFERYGISGRQLDNNLAEASAMVGGMNDARDRDVDRKIALLGGGLGSIGMKTRAQQGA